MLKKANALWNLYHSYNNIYILCAFLDTTHLYLHYIQKLPNFLFTFMCMWIKFHNLIGDWHSAISRKFWQKFPIVKNVLILPCLFDILTINLHCVIYWKIYNETSDFNICNQEFNSIHMLINLYGGWLVKMLSHVCYTKVDLSQCFKWLCTSHSGFNIVSHCNMIFLPLLL